MNHTDLTENNLRRVSASPIITSLPWWLIAIVIVGSALMIAGACFAFLRPEMLLSPGQPITEGVRVYAGYLVSRNLALSLMLLAALALRARAALSTLMLLYAFIQLLDVGNDALEGRWGIVPAIVILGLLFLLGAARLSGHSFWSAKAWRQAS
ncbi:MAG TPA: hypothetical protein VGM11_10285 [Acidobacteriaceae bacterium]|jgi:hypothetical protein